MDLVKLRSFATLSPFEIKDELIRLAKQTAQTSSIALFERRPRQSELGRDDAARGLLPARDNLRSRKAGA